jgi:cytosine/adenosine deaminase-related metal-dependent hydrolase
MPYLIPTYLFDGFSLKMNSCIQVDDEGIVLDILTKKPFPSDAIELKGLLMPGMINCHCHLELSHMKGVIPKHSGLVNFLMTINQSRNLQNNLEIAIAIEQAEKEMIAQGIVAVGDISNKLDTLEQKKKHDLNYHNFIETFGLEDEQATHRFETSLSIWNAFKEIGPSSIVLHAPYSISDTLIQLVDNINQNKLSTIHNQECDAENELFQSGTGDFLRLIQWILKSIKDIHPTGKSSLQSYLPKLSHTNNLILVHNTVTTKEDIEFAQQTNKDLYWCLCPLANLYIENTLPDVNLLYSSDCKLVVGTDSLASNDHLSIWGELSVLHAHFPTISLDEKLKWATSNGAEALGMNTKLGSFESGKQPGIVFIENFHIECPFDQSNRIQTLFKAGKFSS